MLFLCFFCGGRLIHMRMLCGCVGCGVRWLVLCSVACAVRLCCVWHLHVVCALFELWAGCVVLGFCTFICCLLRDPGMSLSGGQIVRLVHVSTATL